MEKKSTGAEMTAKMISNMVNDKLHEEDIVLEDKDKHRFQKRIKDKIRWHTDSEYRKSMCANHVKYNNKRRAMWQNLAEQRKQHEQAWVAVLAMNNSQL